MVCSSHSGVSGIGGRRVRGFRPPCLGFQPWENSRLVVVAVQGAPHDVVYWLVRIQQPERLVVRHRCGDLRDPTW